MATAPSAGSMLKPDDLRRISDEMETAKAKEALEKRRRLEEARSHVRDEFMRRDLRPDALERVNRLVRHAAEQGLNEVMLFQFPAGYCSDHGRAINNFAPDWHESLTGFARKAYDAHVEQLQPLGYRMRAQVLTYPDGNLGDVGVFLSW